MPRALGDDEYEISEEDEVVTTTRLESVEGLRAAFADSALSSPSLPAVKGPQPADDTLASRPVRRPPMALLCVVDDGRAEGEIRRLRADSTVIGRGEGDVVIEHDNMMSGRHAEIRRHHENGRYRWTLADLGSRNGTFVRVTETRLANGHMLLVGGTRLRFDAGGAEPPAPATPPAGTTGWDRAAVAQLLPSLVEITANGDGRRWILGAGDAWVGRDPARCSVLLADDLLVSPQHARIYRDAKNRWMIENAQSRNGVWLRVTRIPIDGAGHFLLGEQRFIFRVL